MTGDDAAGGGDSASDVRGTPVAAEDARDLLVDLVATPSPSGEEAACAERLAAFFEARGREAFLDGAGNVRAPADDAVLLTSHLDTVPGEVPVRVEDGVLRGRGSVDAKGPLAAMAAAAVRAGVGFAGVAGEETDSRGARHLVADRDPPGAVVNGEPGGWDGVTLGYRGLVAGTYRAATPAAHASHPDRNAVQRAVAWWSRVEAAFDAGTDVPVFERVTATPRRFEAGPADDGLSVVATVDAEFRVPPGTDAGEVRGTVAAALEGGSGRSDGGGQNGGRNDVPGEHDGAGARAGHDARVEWTEEIPPVVADQRSPVARALRGAIRAEGGDPRHLRKTGTSDMNLYAAAWDCPVATYGPGDPSLDHAPDERLDLADFDRAVAVLTRVATGLAREE